MKYDPPVIAGGAPPCYNKVGPPRSSAASLPRLLGTLICFWAKPGVRSGQTQKKFTISGEPSGQPLTSGVDPPPVIAGGCTPPAIAGGSGFIY